MKVRKHYLEAENTADEQQHDEDQAHVTESSDLLFVGEVIRLHGVRKTQAERSCEVKGEPVDQYWHVR